MVFLFILSSDMTAVLVLALTLALTLGEMVLTISLHFNDVHTRLVYC